MMLVKSIREELEKAKKDIEKQMLLIEEELNPTLYEIFTINEKRDLTRKQIMCIENILKNALRKFPNVKVFIVVSSSSRKDAHRVKIKTKGRPRVEVRGTRVPIHVHIGAIGNEVQSARGYVELVCERLRKAGIRNRKKSISKISHAINFINYCYRQADSFHQYGNTNFDFKKYVVDYGRLI